MTTKNMSNEIRELCVDELRAVSGGEVTLSVNITPAKTVYDMYNDWVKLGNLMKQVSAGTVRSPS
jgi:hypothetical protein